MILNDTGVPLRELGVDAEGTGWLRGLAVEPDGGWHFRISRGRDGEVRTDVLDELFGPILPVVRMSAVDFL